MNLPLGTLQHTHSNMHSSQLQRRAGSPASQRPAAASSRRLIRPHKSLRAMCACQQADQTPAAKLSQTCSRVGLAAANAVLAGSLLLSAPQATANELKLDADPVYDGAGVLKADARDALSQKLAQLQKDTGYHVRVYTQYYIDSTADAPTPRQLWGSLDNQTVVVRVDPSSPNILSVPFVGDDVLAKLRRPFWTELESRFGNMFYVREQGDSTAVIGAMAALIDCLGRPDGCRVVPGLPPDQYFFTLWCAIAGGLVAGFVSKIEPQGIVQRRWVWLLLFSPLWGSLFINFGLGPIVSRTSDLLPLAGNTAAFLASAAAPGLLQKLWDGEQPGDGQST